MICLAGSLIANEFSARPSQCDWIFFRAVNDVEAVVPKSLLLNVSQHARTGRRKWLHACCGCCGPPQSSSQAWTGMELNLEGRTRKLLSPRCCYIVTCSPISTTLLVGR